MPGRRNSSSPRPASHYIAADGSINDQAAHLFALVRGPSGMTKELDRGHIPQQPPPVRRRRHRPDPRAHHKRPPPRRGTRSQDHPQRRPPGHPSHAAARHLPPPVSHRPTHRPRRRLRSSPCPLSLPIAAEVRRRPIGPSSPISAAMSASCRTSLVAGTAPRHHPLWRQPGPPGEGHLRACVSASRLALAPRPTSGAGPAIPGTVPVPARPDPALPPSHGAGCDQPRSPAAPQAATTAPAGRIASRCR